MQSTLHDFTERFGTMTCVLSVASEPYGAICLEAGNALFCKALGTAVSPGQPYVQYLPEDRRFEEICRRSALHGETRRTSVCIGQSGVEETFTVVPLRSEKPGIGCCGMIQAVYDPSADDGMPYADPLISESVLRICMRLRGSNEFLPAIQDVTADIRQLSRAAQCSVLLTDFVQRTCSVLCTSSDGDAVFPTENINDAFFKVVDHWEDMLAGRSFAVVADEADWQTMQRRNPVWYRMLRQADIGNVILFPLKYCGETIGFIWVLDYDPCLTSRIADTLSLTANYIGSELASYQMYDKMEMLSTKDMLTGILNRNAMNNRVDDFLAGKTDLNAPICIVFADLNGLKLVNDSVGHFSGDILLKDAALTLQKHFPGYEVYRAGGDEFMVMALESDKAKMEQLIRQFREDTADPEGVCFSVGWSYGSIGEIRKAMHEADENMYADKEAFYQKYPERRR